MKRNSVAIVLLLICAYLGQGQTWVKVNGVDDEVRCMTVFNGSIYAGGTFTTSAGQPLSHVGAYAGRTWGTVGAGFDGNVNALHALGGEVLVAAGTFSHSGNIATGHVAQWNGTAWTSMGFGLVGEVYCLGEINGTLLAGGNFFVEDTVYGFAKWNGERWVSTGVSMDNAVYAITNYTQGVMVGGDFTFVGQQFFNHIAKWDGSTWSQVGTGDSTGVYGVVRCMTLFGGKLIVGGGMDGAGSARVNNIAAWNDTVWSALGDGLNGIPSALAVSESVLFVAGTFSQAGGHPAQNVASWSGTDWSPLSLGTSGLVNAATTTANGLYVGGLFTTAGGLTENNFARWSGTANVSTVAGLAFRDKDGKYATLADRTTKTWGIFLYRDSVSPGTLISSGTGMLMAGYVNKAGTYILVEADSGSDWSRLGPRSYRADTLTIALNTTVLDSFVNFHKNSAVGLAVTEGWNLLSSPMDIADNLTTTVFPNASSSLFAYTAAAGYRSTATVENGPGYWLKFDAAATDSLFGADVQTLTIPVKSGWNLIGSITSAVPVASLQIQPSGILRSLFYSYSNGYHSATSIDPGLGYWIKSSGDGSITMTKPSSIHSANAGLQQIVIADEVTVTDASGKSQSIVLATSENGRLTVAEIGELPPPPPGGGFDARLGSVKDNLSGIRSLEISGARYPVSISWKMTTGRRYHLISVNTEKPNIPMSGAGAITLVNAAVLYGVSFGVQPLSGLPTAFALAPNFPNPFNPATVIGMELPQQGIVTLTIYDQLGRETDRLADHVSMDAGRQSFHWQAGAHASGVYHYVATIVDPITGALLFRGSHSMMLVK